MLTAPRDPTRPAELLPWARRINLLLRQLIPRGSGDVLPDTNFGGTKYRARSRARGTLRPALRPFEIIDASEAGSAKVRIIYSSLAGEAPDGFAPGDDPPYILNVADGQKIVGYVTTDQYGVVNSRSIYALTGAIPADTATDFRVEIGSVSVLAGEATPVNARYGPIEFQRCRNFYVAPPSYTAIWSSYEY